MTMIDALYERERLKMQILADMPKIPAFIMNSYRLWGMAQFGTPTPEKVFYGTGTMRDVLGRLLARKSCMAAWRQTKQDDQTLRLIGPMATVLEHSRNIAKRLQDHYGALTPYDALREFQTPGFVDPLDEEDKDRLFHMIKELQTPTPMNVPRVPSDVMHKIIRGLVDIAGVDPFRVEVIDHVAHPACLGYGGMSKGVILGLTFDYADPVLGILTNWHEIGHAVYRQSIPYGRMVHGRAMDEAVAFLYEHVIGRSDEFLEFLLEAGLEAHGYDLEILRAHVRQINRQTQRIETNPLRHLLDISLCDSLERAVINEDVEAEDIEIYWTKLTKPYQDILPDYFPFYWDVHQMTGIYGDRACYNPGLLAAFQIAGDEAPTLETVGEFVRDEICPLTETRFDKAIETLTGHPLSVSMFMQWAQDFYDLDAL